MAKQEWKQAKGSKFNDMINVKEKKGQLTKGIYKGRRDVEIDGDVSVVHSIEIDKVVKDFWGTGSLNFKLAEVPADSEVQIIYNGMVKGTVNVKGKKVTKEIHDFTVNYR